MSIDDGTPEASEAARDAIAAIERLPLEERAPAYLALAERLRAELEHSDPARRAD
ncbi:acyl-CoA reductase-like NAD-dependent aldehyde dehydrogenase [Agromyces terreus]|uniref:Acyl-CoA reductase-like NAD-dependent aldehyde dehydrogenase n=1 Tax=Agromyces terreus TaxID=424795 RepID=A0A9X2H1X1_9MICO|nr:hypothetical protein [Agromyces terreus]MCP2371631.1 acyl-CoA reductase-like NAD-dependent aldehyde dehydrogenase [Agromyces terreus]